MVLPCCLQYTVRNGHRTGALRSSSCPIKRSAHALTFHTRLEVFAEREGAYLCAHGPSDLLALLVLRVAPLPVGQQLRIVHPHLQPGISLIEGICNGAMFIQGGL